MPSPTVSDIDANAPGRAARAVRVAVLPAGLRAFLRDAVVAGGGVVVDDPSQAEALVWAAPSQASELRALLAAHPNIRWVQLPWAGIEPFVDVLDDTHLWTAGQGVYAEPVAEHALALALAGLRDFKARCLAQSWARPSGLSLLGGRVAVVGAGGIARSLARLLAPFHVELTVVRRRADVPFDGAARVLSLSERQRALADADVVFIVCALTGATRGCIGAAELACMRPHAWIVNVARGAVIDTAALVDALRAGRIGGAALDVTDPEPLPPGHPLWSEPRCIITPHVGNTPEMAVPLLTERVRENVARYARSGGGADGMLGVVDVTAGY